MEAAIEALHRRDRHLGVGQQRQRTRAGRGDGLLRRRPHAGNPGRRLAVLRSAFSRSENPRGQCRRSDDASARHRTSARLERRAISMSLFTTDKPVIFAYHGYPWLIHRLTYRRTNHDNMHVRGYKEEGTTTTPFDMVVLNDLDRFHLAGDVIDRVPQARPQGRLRQAGNPRQADRTQGLHPQARPGHAGNPRLEMGRLSPTGGPCHSRGVQRTEKFRILNVSGTLGEPSRPGPIEALLTGGGGRPAIPASNGH